MSANSQTEIQILVTTSLLTVKRICLASFKSIEALVFLEKHGWLFFLFLYGNDMVNSSFSFWLNDLVDSVYYKLMDFKCGYKVIKMMHHPHP